MSPGHSDRSRLKQIGCAALVLIGLAVFVPRTVGHPARRMAHRQRGRRSDLRLQKPIVWPDLVAVDSTRSSESVGSRQEEPGAGIAAASVVWLDHLVGAETY